MRERLVVLVCAVVAPFLIGSALHSREHARHARGDAAQHALEVARLVAHRLDDRLGSTQALLSSVAHVVRTDASQTAYNDSVLLSIRHDLPDGYVTDLWVVDSAGANIGTSFRPLPARAAVAAGDRRYFRDVMRTRRAAIGDPVRERPDSTKWSVSVAQPILSATGAVRAVVIGTIHLSSFRPALEGTSLPAGSVVTLLDAHGTVLGRSVDPDTWVGRNVSDLVSVRGTIGLPEHVGELNIATGEQRLSASTHLVATPWAIYVRMPRNVAYADVSRELKRDLLLGTATLFLALAIALALARRIVSPIDALAADAKALGGGDFARRAASGGPRELATLAATFNDMAATIAARTAELHRSEQRYRLLFDACPLPMYLADIESHAVLAVNEAACAQYGYGRAEFLHLSLLDLRPNEDRLRFLAVTRALAKSQNLHERTHAGLWRHLQKNGTVFEVEIFTCLTEYEGRPVHLSVALDVTARRRAERALRESQDQLRRAQKMEALGRFAGGIAHDFNNLLTGILGYCDLALDEAGLSDETREDFTAIRTAALRAAGLTGQILGFSRGRVVQPIALDLNAVVSNLEPMLSRVIGEHIRLVTASAPSLGTVLADPGQIEQVVLNLALNARDAMPDGGTLTVLTKDVSIDVDDAQHVGVPHGAWVMLQVSDTGIGMDAETQTRIFEPFFTTKDRGQGTGLGLATVYGIVRQCGGTVRASSRPGVGSRFSVYLPLVAGPADERREHDAPIAFGSSRGTETVLLVEDEAAVRAIACEALTRLGYRVLTADNGVDAIELTRLERESIDLLLTDVVMPGMNGRELAELLVRDQPGLRVLFMSGYTDDEVLHRGVSADGVAFLAKPFTPDALAARVRAVLDAGRLEMAGA